MALTENLKVLLTGNGSQLINEFGKVSNASKKAYGNVSKDAQNASTHTGAFDKIAGGVNTRLQKMGIDANVTGGALQAGLGAGAAAAGALVAKFASDGINSFLELTSQARAFQRTTGATAEDASKMAGAIRAVGGDVDATATSFARFGKNIETAPDKFEKYGVAIAKTKDGNTDMVGTFENAAEAISKMTDPAERDAAALELFGKQGANMLPILLKGKEGIKDLFAQTDKHHEVFSQDDLDNGKKLTLATRNLSEAFKGLEVAAAKGLAPLLTSATSGFSKLIDGASSATEKVGGLGGVVKNLAEAAIPGLGALDALGGSGDNAADKLDKLEGKARENISTAGELDRRINGEARAAEEAAKQHEAQAKAIDEVINASLSEIDSSLGLERATSNAADSFTAYNAAVVANAAAGGKNAEAQKALRDSMLDAKEAAVGEAGAAARLASDQAEAAGQTFSASQKAQVYKDELIKVASHVQGPLHDALVDLANKVNIAPPPPIDIIVNTDQARAQLAALADSLGVTVGEAQRFRSFMQGGVTAAQISLGNKLSHIGLAEGGIVTGPQMALIGEAGPELVLPLSKPARMAQLLNQANLIKPFPSSGASFGGSGGSPSGSTVIVNVGGSVITEQNLVTAVRRGLLDTKRRNGSAGLS